MDSGCPQVCTMDGIAGMSQTHSPQWMKMTLLSLAFLGMGGILAWTLADRVKQTLPPPAGINQSAAGSLEGQSAPEFTLKRLDGRQVSLAQYRGKVVFLNFWATWCEPCKEEMPSMQRLYQKLKGKPFEILAVSLDQGGKPAVDAFLAKTPQAVTFPILQDPEQRVSKQLYRTTGVPETFIIGSQGQVLKHVIGSYEWDNPQITQYFENLLTQLASADNA